MEIWRISVWPNHRRTRASMNLMLVIREEDVPLPLQEVTSIGTQRVGGFFFFFLILYFS